MRVFGAKTIVLNKMRKRKFSPKGEEHILVGYAELSKAYRLYNFEKRRVITARDVIFIEDDFTKKDLAKVSEYQIVELQCETPVDECLQVEPEVSSSILSSTEQQPQDVEARRGPGRPKMILTGLPGRPKKQYTMLNILTTEDVSVPSSY
ncbi:hypothetical protein KR067_013300, partial [Drosophila pandora]